MDILEQLDSVIPCVKALRDIMPRDEKEDFVSWVQRGLAAGLVTAEERDKITRVYVYQPMLLIQHLEMVAA